MTEVAHIGRQVAQTPEVKARVSRLLSEHAVANTWLTEEYYIEQVQPRLKSLKARSIADAINVSHAYAALVRAGKRRPHPRHWCALAELAEAVPDTLRSYES